MSWLFATCPAILQGDRSVDFGCLCVSMYFWDLAMQTPVSHRRVFLGQASAAAAACFAWPSLLPRAKGAEDAVPFRISLAQWSLNRAFRGGKLDNLDFAKVARNEFGIDAIEYVNQMFFEKGNDQAYLAEMKKRASDHGVKSLLIMIDREGNLGEPDSQRRKQAVEKHYKWVEAAKFLGCHSVRVNAATSEQDFEKAKDYAADGLRQLSEFAKPLGLNVIVENHGGLSSNGKWLSETIQKVGLPNCGTLPDFGNFRLGDGQEYDRYLGVAELMPYAKAVSAKSYDFDDKGQETKIDYLKMLSLVLRAGYHGYVGIEYEGKVLGEYEGIRATKNLLERCQRELALAK
jgi:L-ribulose-5-phosphate 3-epimerase